MEWNISKEPVDYAAAVAFMEARVQKIRANEADDLIWLLEHPPLYTAGTSAKDSDLVDSKGFPVYKTGRGGQYTYHGPGQRIAYVMLDLKKRTPDVRLFVQNLEHWIIDVLAGFDVKGEVREGRVGVWVEDIRAYGAANATNPRNEGGSVSEGGDTSPPFNHESKIAAVGVRIKQWVTYHGISININPDLRHYDGIIPCGIKDYGVTSLEKLGITTCTDEFDTRLIKSFNAIF